MEERERMDSFIDEELIECLEKSLAYCERERGKILFHLRRRRNIKFNFNL